MTDNEISNNGLQVIRSGQMVNRSVIEVRKEFTVTMRCQNITRTGHKNTFLTIFDDRLITSHHLHTTSKYPLGTFVITLELLLFQFRPLLVLFGYQ